MATQVPPIGRPNYVAIAGMDSRDLFEVREYYIMRLVQARRENDSDTIENCLDWVVALVAEMRLRGSDRVNNSDMLGIVTP